MFRAMAGVNARVRYELTSEDYLAFADFSQGKAAHENRWLWRLVVYVGSMAATTVSLAVSDALTTSSVVTAAILTGVFLLLYMAWLWPRNAVRAQRKRYYQGRMLEERTVELGEAGVRESSVSGESVVRWNAIERVAVTAEYLFHVSAIGSYIVPKRSFAIPDDFAAFVAVAQQYWRPAPSTDRIGGFPVIKKNSTQDAEILESSSSDD
jgi:hypothetical protein